MRFPVEFGTVTRGQYYELRDGCSDERADEILADMQVTHGTGKKRVQPRPYKPTKKNKRS